MQLVFTKQRARSEHLPAEPQRVAVTPREDEVLRLISLGKANKEIAAVLGNTERTVKHHVGNLLRKFGVTTRMELLASLQQIARAP